MASDEVFEAVKGLLTAGFTDFPLVFENDDGQTSDVPGPFVFVEVFGDFYAQASIGAPGANLWRETGQVLMHVMVPRGEGTSRARTIARDLVGLFREVEVSGVVFDEMSIGAGEPGDEKANYFRMTATVSYRRDD